MSNSWFSSDFHGFHKNICRGTSTWGTKHVEAVSGIHGIQHTRDFDTVEEMNAAILKGINDNVKENDNLYYLGDWTFGGIDKIWEFRKQIKCKNMHLIYGNHDEHIEADKELPNVHIDYPKGVGAGKIGILTGGSCPRNLQGYDKMFIRPAKPSDLFKSTQHYKHISFGKQEIIMSHYAMRVWNRSHHGAIHLYGHSHDSLDNPARGGSEWGKSMDVGIDSAKRILGEYRPFSLSEILDIMSNREALIVDHHNKHTT